MARQELNLLDDDARIWVFGITPALNDEQASAVLRQVDEFLDQWKAHSVPVTSARELRDGSFLIIAVDRRSETSGCSIDRMYGLLRRFEGDFRLRILDPDVVFVRSGDGSVRAMTRSEFRQSADPHTVVFDLLSERLGDVRKGTWERPAKDSWHARLLATTV